MRLTKSHIAALNVQIISVVTALVGAGTVLSAISPGFANRLVLLDDVVAILLQSDAVVATVVLGVALFILAFSLWQRKRSGWLLTIVILVSSAILQLVRGLAYQEAIIALVVAGWLFTLRTEFHTRSDRPSAYVGLGLLVVSIVFPIIYGAAGFAQLDTHFQPDVSWGAALGQSARLFVAPGTLTVGAVTTTGAAFIVSIYTLMVIMAASALILLSRSVIVRLPATDEERTQAEQIVTAHGRSSLARMTLLEDKSYYVSPGGSVVAYVAKNGFAVALGDPIGPVEDIDNAIKGFQAHAKQNGWRAVFYQVLPDHVPSYEASGLKLIPIGQEAIVDLSTFTLSGRSRKSMRQHFNRVKDRGYRAVVHQPPIDDDLYNTLWGISDEWLTHVGTSEKRFSLGWFHEDYIRPVPIMCIYDAEDEIVAFANILPEYQLNETTIDLMRHRSQMESGVMDFLFVSLFEWAKEQGYDTFNLGLVALAGVGQNPDDPAIERGIHYLFEHLNQVYNFKGLYDFKNKFQPEWVPRYLVHPGLIHLPGVAVALVRADSGDDAIWTYLRELELRRLAAERFAKLRQRQKATAS